jgi:hypothetical protein
MGDVADRLEHATKRTIRRWRPTEVTNGSAICSAAASRLVLDDVVFELSARARRLVAA